MPGNPHAYGRESLRRKVSAPHDDAAVSAPLPAEHAANAAAPTSGAVASQLPQSAQPAPGGFDFGQVPLYPSTSEIGPDGGEPSPALTERIKQQHGGGAPLDAPTRTTMESAFGHNFGDVRIFADGEADQLNRSISASAFTHGSDIFLSQEALSYDAEGREHLLAHELTHVVQQQGMDSAGAIAVAPEGDAGEQEAETVAHAVTEAIHNQPAAGEATADQTPGVTIGRMPSAAAIGRSLIQRDPPANPAPTTAAPVPASPTGYKGRLDVDLWVESVRSGPVPSGVARNNTKSYIGDQHVITADVKGPLGVDTDPSNIDFKEPSEAGLHMTLMMISSGNNMSDCKIDKRWQSPGVAEWVITPLTPGHQHVLVSISDADWENTESYELDIAAGADPTWFKGRCSTAESNLNTLYAAGRTWFSDCFASYKGAYDAFQSALNKQRNADQLAADLVLGVLFAAVGGAAGGAVGAKVANMMAEVKEAGEVIKPALFNATTRAALTDAAKDVAKFVARIPARQPIDASKSGTPPGPTTDPSQSAAPMGERAVPAVDPLSWFVAIDGAIAAERAAVGQQLVDAQKAADEAVVLDPAAVIDWDPVAVLEDVATLNGKPLRSLGAVPQSIAYERSFWETWLENYAYHVAYMPGDVPGGAGYYVGEGIGKKLREEIDRVAQKFGESGDDWIERYGGVSKAKAQKEVDEKND